MNWKELKMKKNKMTIELLSDTISGSGEGFGAVIDTDVQYDEFGIPFISAKRIKGSLRNSLNEILEMPIVSEAKNCTKQYERDKILSLLFGETGSVESSSLFISNFFVADYQSVKSWFSYLIDKYPDIFSNQKILSTLTNIRRQTKVNEAGIAEDHSLRSSRAVNKGLKFEAEISIEEDNNNIEEYLALACANLRKIGTKRNRGLGDVKCELDSELITNSINKLEKELEGK